MVAFAGIKFVSSLERLNITAANCRDVSQKVVCALFSFKLRTKLM